MKNLMDFAGGEEPKFETLNYTDRVVDFYSQGTM